MHECLSKISLQRKSSYYFFHRKTLFLSNSVEMHKAQLTQKSHSNQADFCWSVGWIHVTNLKIIKICGGTFLPSCENPEDADSNWNDLILLAK